MYALNFEKSSLVSCCAAHAIEVAFSGDDAPKTILFTLQKLSEGHINEEGHRGYGGMTIIFKKKLKSENKMDLYGNAKPAQEIFFKKRGIGEITSAINPFGTLEGLTGD